jgi:hypothetical protein
LQRADSCVLLIGTRKDCLSRFHLHRQDVLAKGLDLVERAARAAPAHSAVRRHLPGPRRWPCSLRSFWRFLCIDLGHAALLTWSQGQRLASTSRVATWERQVFGAMQASHLPLAAQVCPGQRELPGRGPRARRNSQRHRTPGGWSACHADAGGLLSCDRVGALHLSPTRR